MATSSRLTESSAAISILINNPLRLIAGAGIGAFFYPWSSTIGYYDYISYYAHIAPISFLWIGGIILVLNVYIFFFSLFFKSLALSLSEPQSKSLLFIPFWILAIMLNSLSGADLLNSPVHWAFVGFAFGFVRLCSRPTLFSFASV